MAQYVQKIHQGTLSQVDTVIFWVANRIVNRIFPLFGDLFPLKSEQKKSAYGRH